MANVCVICDKRPRTGNNVSHAHNKTRRQFKPNVHKTRFRVVGSTNVSRGAVCTKCVKAGKIEKVV